VVVALGRPISVNAEPLSQVRYHSATLLLMSKALENASRRQLLSEIRSQVLRSGIYEHSEEELTRIHEDRWSAIPYAWVAIRLLARPAVARAIVGNTVANYALTAEAAERIRSIPLADLEASLGAIAN
jgi:predicted RNase H-like nuclease